MSHKELTEKKYWDSRWDRVRLPAVVEKKSAKSTTKEIIKLVDLYLPRKEGLTILEIGGAPGRWLAYFKRNFHYGVHAIDYSETGCAKIQENFDKLNLDITIYRCNILTDDLSALPRFDVVYSMGFVEHFSDLDVIIEKHLNLLKGGGILMLGVPNFAGIAKYILKKTSPGIFSTHNLKAMEIENWDTFEEKFKLKTLYKGYIGGFDMHNCQRCENRTLINRLIRLFFKTATRFTNRIKFFSKFNSKYWSPYLLVMYKKG